MSSRCTMDNADHMDSPEGESTGAQEEGKEGANVGKRERDVEDDAQASAKRAKTSDEGDPNAAPTPEKRLAGERIVFQKSGVLHPNAEQAPEEPRVQIHIPAGSAKQPLHELIREEWDRGPKLDRGGLGYDSMEAFTPQTHDWSDVENKQFPVQQSPQGIQCRQVPGAFDFCLISLVKDVPDQLPSDAFTRAGQVEEMLQCKTRFDKLEGRRFTQARDKANPYEFVKKFQFACRAAIKILEMDHYCHITAIPLLPEEGDVLHFGDVCAAPGGWTEYVLWRVIAQNGGRAKGYGMSLKQQSYATWEVHKFCDGAREHVQEEGFAYWGPHGDGDITKNDNMSGYAQHVRQQTGGVGLALLMADGGICVDGSWNDQEKHLRQIILCEMLTALLTVRKGGWYVCKLFDTYTEFTANLLYIMYRAFEEVVILKPFTSRPANSERYIICKGKLTAASFAAPGGAAAPGLTRAPDGDVCRFLYHVNDLLRHNTKAGDLRDGMTKQQVDRSDVVPTFDDADDLVSIVDRAVMLADRSFVDWLTGVNARLVASQIHFLRETAKHVEDPQGPADYREQVAVRFARLHGLEWKGRKGKDAPGGKGGAGGPAACGAKAAPPPSSDAGGGPGDAPGPGTWPGPSKSAQSLRQKGLALPSDRLKVMDDEREQAFLRWEKETEGGEGKREQGPWGARDRGRDRGWEASREAEGEGGKGQRAERFAAPERRPDGAGEGEGAGPREGRWEDRAGGWGQEREWGRGGWGRERDDGLPLRDGWGKGWEGEGREGGKGKGKGPKGKGGRSRWHPGQTPDHWRDPDTGRGKGAEGEGPDPDFGKGKGWDGDRAFDHFREHEAGKGKGQEPDAPHDDAARDIEFRGYYRYVDCYADMRQFLGSITKHRGEAHRSPSPQSDESPCRPRACSRERTPIPPDGPASD